MRKTVIVSKEIIQLFNKQRGYLQSSQLGRRSLKYHLKAMHDAGEIIRIKPGLYKHPDYAQDNDWAEVCHLVPAGVLCLFSAWHYFSLTTQVPSQYHIAIPNKAKIRLPEYPPLKIYYWSEPYYSLGVQEITKNKDVLRIYAIEKSVCDAVRFRNKAGVDITSEVLGNYLKRTDRNLDLLIKYARTMRVETIMKQYLEVLI